MDITQEMIGQSAAEEGELLSHAPAVLLAQNQHLLNRVVALRAVVNEQSRALEAAQEELKKLKARRRPSDHQTKKVPAKKTASSKP